MRRSGAVTPSRVTRSRSECKTVSRWIGNRIATGCPIHFLCETRMIDLIKSKFPEAVSGPIEFRGETTIVVQPERLIEVCTFLRDDPALKFDLLSDVSAVDHLPAQPRFAVNYHLYSLENNYQLRLKVQLDGEEPHVSSLTSVWPGANWHEREVWDL